MKGKRRWPVKMDLYSYGQKYSVRNKGVIFIPDITTNYEELIKSIRQASEFEEYRK